MSEQPPRDDKKKKLTPRGLKQAVRKLRQGMQGTVDAPPDMRLSGPLPGQEASIDAMRAVEPQPEMAPEVREINEADVLYQAKQRAEVAEGLAQRDREEEAARAGRNASDLQRWQKDYRSHQEKTGAQRAAAEWREAGSAPSKDETDSAEKREMSPQEVRRAKLMRGLLASANFPESDLTWEQRNANAASAFTAPAAPLSREDRARLFEALRMGNVSNTYVNNAIELVDAPFRRDPRTDREELSDSQQQRLQDPELMSLVRDIASECTSDGLLTRWGGKDDASDVVNNYATPGNVEFALQRAKRLKETPALEKERAALCERREKGEPLDAEIDAVTDKIDALWSDESPLTRNPRFNELLHLLYGERADYYDEYKALEQEAIHNQPDSLDGREFGDGTKDEKATKHSRLARLLAGFKGLELGEDLREKGSGGFSMASAPSFRNVDDYSDLRTRPRVEMQGPPTREQAGWVDDEPKESKPRGRGFKGLPPTMGTAPSFRDIDDFSPHKQPAPRQGPPTAEQAGWNPAATTKPTAEMYGPPTREQFEARESGESSRFGRTMHWLRDSGAALGRRLWSLGVATKDMTVATAKGIGKDTVAAAKGVGWAVRHPFMAASAAKEGLKKGYEGTKNYGKYFFEENRTWNERWAKLGADSKALSIAALEGYNKMPMHRKLEITAALIGASAVTGAVGLSSTAWVLAKAMYGQRVLAGAGFGLNRGKGVAEKAAAGEKHWLLGKHTGKEAALAYGGVSALTYGVAGMFAGRWATEKLTEGLTTAGKWVGGMLHSNDVPPAAPGATSSAVEQAARSTGSAGAANDTPGAGAASSLVEPNFPQPHIEHHIPTADELNQSLSKVELNSDAPAEPVTIAEPLLSADHHFPQPHIDTHMPTAEEFSQHLSKVNLDSTAAETAAAPAASPDAPASAGAPVAPMPDAPASGGSTLESIHQAAASGKGYEYDLKHGVWDKIKALHLKPEDYAPKVGEQPSDLYRLLTANDNTINKVVHELATKHHFYNPDGTSVRIDPNAELTVGSDGSIMYAEHAGEAASADATQAEAAHTTPVYHPHAPVAEADTAHAAHLQEVNSARAKLGLSPLEQDTTTAGNAAALEAARPGAGVAEDGTASTDVDSELAEESAQSTASGAVPAENVTNAPSSVTDFSHVNTAEFIQSHGSEPHLYADAGGKRLTLWGSSYPEQLKFLAAHAAEHPSSAIDGVSADGKWLIRYTIDSNGNVGTPKPVYSDTFLNRLGITPRELVKAPTPTTLASAFKSVIQ